MSGRALDPYLPDLVKATLLLAMKYDIQSDVYFRLDDNDEIVPYVLCNDLFFWGCADGEDITADNLPELERAIQDCNAIVTEEFHPISCIFWGPDLFCARMRKMRPQGAQYSSFPEEIWHLFHECGPEREVGYGNPYAPGEYTPKWKRPKDEEE